MKRCPSCQATYPDTQSFCSTDGTALVADQPPAEPAQTVIAQPPPPPTQGSGGEVPPTQVVTPNQQYNYQPTPPMPEPPPYAPQPPQAAYAPQYQQQQPYAHQGYAAPKSRKLLYIGIAAVIVLAGIGVLLWFLLSGGKSLGTYKGSLADLTPAKVGSYEQKRTGTIEEALGRGDAADVKTRLGYDDGRIALYESSGKRIVLVVGNFSSPEKAKDALQTLKQQIRSPAVSVKEEGASKRGSGNRVVYSVRPGPNSPETNVIVWTNGSVGFIVGPAALLRGPRADDPSLPSTTDVLDFEKNLSY